MNDTAIKNFCLEARHLLEQQVQQCAVKYGIVEEGAPAPDAVAVGEVALTELQRSQRAQLLELQAGIGHEELVRRAAYTWFNRLVAIRFMEVNGYLPSGVRVLSAPDGTFNPEILTEALRVGIQGIDQAKVLELLQSGQDEPLFRYLFLLQCQELAECLPSVFEPVGGAMELLLPDGLSRKGSVADLLVSSLPETEDDGTPSDTWQNVEALGWMYQYYNAERKDEFFSSKRKAAAEDLAPATQLFTPEWIVRYMVENSLGRLWMLNHPDSQLRQHMDYYIEPDAEHEDFLHIGSPEEITFCDPACGSGHILSYAFELLFLMYKESGYREREIPSLILKNNLSGFEIDRRAAQIANLVLALRARKHDRRFFGRGVQADVCVLESIPFEEGELACCGKPLAEALAHLGEVGSLLAPTEDDLQSLREELANCEGDLFAAAKADKLKLAIGKCEQLSRRFDVVVANPPYMGSGKFNPFMGKWAKKNYPDVKSDLCTCFIERGFSLAKEQGYAAMVTMQSWMFLGSFEKMRGNIIANKGIVTMAHLGPRAFDAIGGEVVSVTADVVCNGKLAGAGTYVRLVDVNGSEEKRLKLLEAIQNPDCGWFYRRDAQTFTQIPGTPIAYWASDAALNAFTDNPKLGDVTDARVGLITGNGDRFLRRWQEVELTRIGFGTKPYGRNSAKWIPYTKGGEYRLWFGNNEYVVNWENDGWEMKNDNYDKNSAKGTGRVRAHNFNGTQAFKEGFCWNSISSGQFHGRYTPEGFMFDAAGPLCEVTEEGRLGYVIGLMSSSVFRYCMTLMNPTLNFPPGYLQAVPYLHNESSSDAVRSLVDKNIDLSTSDWDSFETSWDFKRHPLL